MRGLRQPLSPEANSEAGQAWGTESRCPTASAETVLPSQTPASIPRRCLALGGQLCGAGHAQPEAQPPEARRHQYVTGCQVLNKTLTLPLAGRGLLGRAAQMTGEGETGSLIGWGGGHQAWSRRWATLPRDPKGVGSLLTWCRLAFLSGLVGEAADRREAERTGEREARRLSARAVTQRASCNEARGQSCLPGTLRRACGQRGPGVHLPGTPSRGRGRRGPGVEGEPRRRVGRAEDDACCVLGPVCSKHSARENQDVSIFSFEANLK